MIRSVLFDLDRTLLDRDKSFHDFLLSQYERFAPVLGHVHREKFISRVTALDNRGRVGKDKVYQCIVEELRIHEISSQELQEDFESRISDYYVPFSNLRKCLNDLKASGYTLGMVSNGRHDFQMRSIRKLEIEQDFSAILTSESEGLRKPDPEIFHRALRKLDSFPDQGVFVGDHPDVDIKGARDAGMKTIWKKNDDFSRPIHVDAVFEDLEELPAIIESLSDKPASC